MARETRTAPAGQLATTPRPDAPIAAPIPRGFASLGPVNVGNVETVDKDAFIWFASRKSKLWGDIEKRMPPQQQLVEGDVVYVSPDLTERLGVLKYHLVTANQYFALAHPATGRPSGKAWRTKDAAESTAKEFIDAVILVYTSRGLMPARIVFKSGLIPAITPALKELDSCVNDPTWKDRSADHAIAMRFDPPYLRFVASASFASRQSKSSGMPYLAGSCACKPTTSTEATAIAKLGEVATLCELVAAEHGKRTAEIEKMMS